MDEKTRIERFMKMINADPSNELGHFSLGKALLEGDHPAEAIEPLAKTVELNPKLSKAYHLLGEAFHKVGRVEEAIETLTSGVVVADELGDRMPQLAMVHLLKSLGAPIPKLKTDGQSAGKKPRQSGGTQGESGSPCARCGSSGTRLSSPPFKGELGLKVYELVCESCWREWIGMGTKIINELALEMANPAAQDTYDQYMIEFLGLEGR